MSRSEISTLLRKLDQRVTRIEQILPTLAAKQDLAPFATKEELREEGDRWRRHMTILFEELNGKFDTFIEAYSSQERRIGQHELRLDDHDTKLEAFELRLKALGRAPKSSS